MNCATTASMLNDITILIPTFKRPDSFQRLLDSIDRFYPDIKILIHDDSGADRGVSYSRNHLVELAKTKYVFLCDDDAVFTEKTDLLGMKRLLEEQNLDILSVEIPGLNYHGKYELNGETLYMNPTEGLCDFVIQFFLAKRETLLNHKWDERFKIGEHNAFFFKHRGKMRISHTKEYSIEHHQNSNEEYANFRNRAMDYVHTFMDENNIKKIVGVDVHIIQR